MKGWPGVAGMCLVSVVALAACSSSETEVAEGEGEGGEKADLKSGQTELRVAWWGSQARHDRTIEAIKLFEAENPDIAVTTEFTGWDGYWERMSTQAAGRNLPDVIQMDLQYINEYVSRDLLVDLTPYVENGTLDFSDVDDIYLEGGIVEEGLYGINLGSNAMSIAYDAEIFAEAGVPELEPGYTWDDYIEAVKTINENLDGMYAYAFGDNLNFFKHYLRQHDLWLYNEDNTGLGYDDDKYLIDFLNMYKDLLDSGVAAPPDVKAEVQGIQDELIVHSRASTFSPHSNQIVALNEAAGRKLQMTTLPAMEGGSEASFIKPSLLFSATSQGDKSEEAARFINFFVNSIEANEILNAERGVPISEKVRDHLYDHVSENTQLQFDYVQLVEQRAAPIHPPDPAGTGQILDLYARMIEEFEYELLSAEEFAERFRGEVEIILSN
ncbi:extracellular solute-binding protein [Shouchella clausii]|uniref:ABC transporter substrate-binding protein n=1 Tax=Shouchella clausii TaxID=79880 RepID=UPI0031FE0C06